MQEKKKIIFGWIGEVLIANGYEKVNVAEVIDIYIKEMQQENENFLYELYKAPQDKIQYVLVVDVCDAKIANMKVEAIQFDIYKQLLKLGNELDLAFDKNVSLLLCVNGNIENESLERDVLRLEENPYCFKKFVLTYTDEEICELESRMEEEVIWEYMQKTIQQLREGIETNIEDIATKFVLKLYIKMPFLAIDIVRKQKKENLMETINQNLDVRYQKIWRELKEMNIEEIEDIKQYTETQQEKILERWYIEEE